jgi:hypothetical protein
MSKTFTLICLAVPALIIGTPAALATYDAQEVTKTYRVGHSFLEPGMVVTETATGTRLGMYEEETVVGRYAAGQPGVVAFGCEGTDGVMIAMEESDLPRCDRVEPIQYKDKASWAS